jgi:pyrroloquinoline quinone biosynthesis protein D
MIRIDDKKIPVLARGCRMGKDAQLLVPEGLIKLSPSAARIIELCDGQRTVAGIISTLQSEYDNTASDQIRSDVTEYLAQLVIKKAVELK